MGLLVSRFLRTVVSGTGVWMLYAGIACATPPTLAMPEALVAYAAKNGCGPIPDFSFNRPGINPTYAYGYLPGPTDSSAVLWCQTGQGDQRKFWLLIMQGHKARGYNCPTKLEWRAGFPGGLSIYHNVQITLKDFHYYTSAESQSRKPPPDGSVSGSVIVSQYDGIAEELYCYTGEWLIHMRD